MKSNDPASVTIDFASNIPGGDHRLFWRSSPTAGWSGLAGTSALLTTGRSGSLLRNGIILPQSSRLGTSFPQQRSPKGIP